MLTTESDLHIENMHQCRFFSLYNIRISRTFDILFLRKVLRSCKVENFRSTVAMDRCNVRSPRTVGNTAAYQTCIVAIVIF